MNKNKLFLWILAGALLPMAAATVFLLTTLGGPTENGLRCARSSVVAECEVQRTRFLGLFGNSAFTVPESSLRGAKYLCGSTKVGGRGSPSCNVYLTRASDPDQDIVVLSYALSDPADAAVKQLNHYFQNQSARWIEIKPDLLTPVGLFALAPILFVAVIMGMRWWGFHRKAPAA